MGKIGSTRDKKDQVNKVIKYLEKYTAGNIAINLVNEKWIEDFQTYLLRETGLSKNTASRYEAAVRLALRKAARDRVIPRNPADGVKIISSTETDKAYLTQPEIQRLANIHLGGTLGAEVKRAFLFACYTGLRISDLKSIAWNDITLEPLQINKRQEKTNRKVFVPLHPVAWEIINDGTIHNYKALIFPEM
jgi:integrase